MVVQYTLGRDATVSRCEAKWLKTARPGQSVIAALWTHCSAWNSVTLTLPRSGPAILMRGLWRLTFDIRPVRSRPFRVGLRDDLRG
jgi:hypothetical protein